MSINLEQHFKGLDDGLTPRNLVPGDPQLYVQLSSPLNGMLPSIACLRCLKFAKPFFVMSLVLSMFSLFGNKSVQDVLVSAVMGSMSITLLKLLLYLNMLLCGLSLVISQRELAHALQIIDSFLCDISFDCASVSMGVVTGIYLAACISTGFWKTTFNVIFILMFFIVVNFLMWTFANTSILLERAKNFELYQPWIKKFAGYFLLIVVTVSLMNEPWKDVSALHPTACPPTVKSNN